MTSSSGEEWDTFIKFELHLAPQGNEVLTDEMPENDGQEVVNDGLRLAFDLLIW